MNELTPFKKGDNAGKRYYEIDDESLDWIINRMDDGSKHHKLATQEKNRRMTDDSEDVVKMDDALASMPS
jgi:hypothetical protein